MWYFLDVLADFVVIHVHFGDPRGHFYRAPQTLTRENPGFPEPKLLSERLLGLIWQRVFDGQLFLATSTLGLQKQVLGTSAFTRVRLKDQST